MQFVYVGDYGAIGDGTADDTAAVQSALNDAAARGVPLVFGNGVYRVEGLTATAVDQVIIQGQGQKSTTLKLRDDNGLGGVGQILLLTDVIAFGLYDIAIHGNFANAKAGSLADPLVLYRSTSATRGREDFAVHIENVDLTESAKGFGQIGARIDETPDTPFSRFAHVVVRNVQSFAHGNFGPAVRVNGPAELVYVEAMSTRNDGPYGLECYGPVTYPGSAAKPLTISCDKDIDHHTRQAVVTGLSCFRDNGGLFVQRVKRLDASGITVNEDCTNPFYDVAPVNFTVDPATDVVSAPIPAGKYGNSSVVKLSTTGTLPKPLVPGGLYFVRDRSGNTFRLATTSGTPAINLTDSGSGTHSIEFLGYTYTTAIKGDDNTHTPDDPVRHRFTNVSVTRSSPHTGNRNFSWEETFVGTVGQVVLEDCNFNRPVNVASHYPGLRPTVRGCTFEAGWLTNVVFGTASPLAMVDGVAEDCVFKGFVTLTQTADLVIRNCRFAVPLRHFMSPGASAILRLHENVWNLADTASATLLLSPPRNGGKLLIEMRGNRIPQGAAHTTTVKLSSTDKTGLTVSATDNDLIMGF